MYLQFLMNFIYQFTGGTKPSIPGKQYYLFTLIFAHQQISLTPIFVPGVGTRIQNDGYVRPEIGDLENDPYGDSQRHKKIPLQRLKRQL